MTTASPPFRSSLPGINTPALFDRRGAQLAATMYQLEQSEWWTAAQLRQAQGEQLACLVAYAMQHVPYYRERYSELNLPSDPIALQEQWQQLPLLTRSDITAAGKQLFTTKPLAGHGKIRKISTSGSTGRPLKALSTGLNEHFYQAMTMRSHFWHGRDTRKKLSQIRPDRVQTMTGVETKSWGRPVHYLFGTGPSSLLYSTVTIVKQVDWLLAQNPVYLLSMPNNLKGLAEELQRRGETLPKLKQIISYAENLSPDLRTYLQNAFAVPIVDIYSSVEVGYIAIQCPDFEHYHLQSEVVMTEVLDDQDKPCAPGQVGRLILTPLHNFASPLIRYEIDDYVEVGEPCPCGRGLPVINRILGRERNLITLPDGSRHWPYLAIGHWSSIAPIEQAQVVQKTVHDLEVRLIMERALKPAEESELGEFLSKQLHQQFNYQFSYHKSLKRGRNGKFEDFISELASDPVPISRDPP